MSAVRDRPRLRSPRGIAPYGAFAIATALGATFALVGLYFLASFASLSADVLPYAIASTVAVGLMLFFGALAPANEGEPGPAEESGPD